METNQYLSEEEETIERGCGCRMWREGKIFHVDNTGCRDGLNCEFFQYSLQASIEHGNKIEIQRVKGENN